MMRFSLCIWCNADTSRFTRQENKSRAVRQFHFHGWPEVGIPSDGKGMINIIAAVQKQQQQSGNHPITVHCRQATPPILANQEPATLNPPETSLSAGLACVYSYQGENLNDDLWYNVHCKRNVSEITIGNFLKINGH